MGIIDFFVQEHWANSESRNDVIRAEPEIMRNFTSRHINKMLVGTLRQVGKAPGWHRSKENMELRNGNKPERWLNYRNFPEAIFCFVFESLVAAGSHLGTHKLWERKEIPVCIFCAFCNNIIRLLLCIDCLFCARINEGTYLHFLIQSSWDGQSFPF